MLLQSLARALPGVVQKSGQPSVPGGTFGELMESTLAGAPNYPLVKSGRVFTVSSFNQAVANFSGNGLSSPSFSMYNPVDNGYEAVILSLRVCVRTYGTGQAVDFGWYAGTPAGGTMSMNGSASTGAYGYSNGGNSVYAGCNTPITFNAGSGNNLVMIQPSLCLGLIPTPTPPASSGMYVEDPKGSLVVSPGVVLCWGVIGSSAGGIMDISVTWAELPV